MLTKDLLRLRANGEYLRPQFVPTDDPEWLEFAAGLIRLYESGIGAEAGELDDTAEALAMRKRDLKLSRGIVKVVRARAEFSGEKDVFDYTDARKNLFLETAKLIREKALPESPADVRDAVFSRLPSELAGRGIYADLPEHETLVRFAKTFPREALDRYNTGLVQGALLTASAIDLETPAEKASQSLRQLFRKLKFFRLLFTGRLENGKIKLHIDGPASILEHGTKYGLELAKFFPSVCHLPKWKLACTVERNGKNYRLVLDETSGLRAVTPAGAGLPEEYQMFADYFQTQNTGWILDGAPGFLHLGGQTAVFPDFAFRPLQGNADAVYLELFHRWHARQLEERLTWCEAHPETRLAIGVDRALLKKDGMLKSRLEESPYFQRAGFLFRDFPGAGNVAEVLENFISRP